ncbi:hypothetical protein HMPREF1548_04772 [Clostridium sp. KLE 1755]|nr:hypothetical protein HMPREF1548_04772 [Clostridium sp. KLE 1755]
MYTFLICLLIKILPGYFIYGFTVSYPVLFFYPAYFSLTPKKIEDFRPQSVTVLSFWHSGFIQNFY